MTSKHPKRLTGFSLGRILNLNSLFFSPNLSYPKEYSLYMEVRILSEVILVASLVPLISCRYSLRANLISIHLISLSFRTSEELGGYAVISVSPVDSRYSISIRRTSFSLL